jgi:PAS domain S-box-containing protein
VISGISSLFENDHFSLEYRFQHKDGSYRWMSDALQLERDGSGHPVRIVGYWIDISDQKLAKQALSDSETRYRQMAELSPDGMFVHVDGKIVFANAKLAQILVISSPADLFGTPAIELIAPEYRDHIKRRRGKVMQGEITKLGQSEFLRSDGSRVPVERTGALITWEGEPAILVLIRDVSEREATAEALRESRDQLRLVTDNLPVLIVYIDAQRNYRFVNKICAEWHARPSEEIIGKSVSELTGQEYVKFDSRIEKVLNGEQQTFVDTVAYPDGATRTVRATFIPHRGTNGGVEGYFALVEDISELQQAEEALRHALKMEAVGQLTGGVAHDFNNLLAVILGNTELLGHEMGDNPLLATIDRAATRGAELTQRLLAFSRQQALQPQSNDLMELIPGLHDLFHRTLGEPVKISMDVPEGIWPVTADPGQLENALLNLAINARDAMPEGGTLEISCENVQLHDNDKVAAGDYVQIAVRDSGSGMPEDVLEHAFEPFYTTKDVGEGSGLGLSMVYGFARQSGGDATIESKPGTGTEVKLLLPRSEVTTMSDELSQSKDMKRGQEEAILVLEDDPDVRSFAVAALEGLGYRVHQAADAAAAMKVLEEEADKLDLLLSDVVLPGGVSGPELAAKAKELYPKLKLVFMSGYAADLYTDDKIPGFDETLLTKPFRLAELSKAVHDTLAG